MHFLFILVFSLLSNLGLAQTEKRFLCDTIDTSGTIELNSSYTVVISDQDAFLNTGTHTISLEELVLDGNKTTIYSGEDTKFGYAFYSKVGVLGMANHSENVYYSFKCN